MRWPAARLLAVAVLAAGLLVPADRAAGSCALPAEHPDNVARAEVIFSGTLVEDTASAPGETRRYTFRVDAVYKGDAYAEQAVVTPTTSSIELDLEGPGPYLVLGRAGGRWVESDSCSGTRPLAAADLSALGPSRPPLAGSSPSAPWWAPVVAVGIAGGAVVAMAALRARMVRRRFDPDRDG